MTIYLVRHARGESRARWNDDDALRPLSEKGRAQAEALADHFERSGTPSPARIVCGPSLRCQQTVAPLAERLGVAIEVDERLGRAEPAARALELFPRQAHDPVLFCTHLGVVAGLLTTLELVDSEPDCKKGAFWALEGGYAPRSAGYFEPTHRLAARSAETASPEVPESIRAAALDMGSTSFNLLIADVTRDGEITPVVREKVMLRIGAVIAQGADIPEEVCERAVEVARDLRQVARHEKVQRFVPVATAALRDALNGEEVAARLSGVLGTPVRILSGEEEARVIFRAFQTRLEIGKHPVLGVDLGGGSLELAVGDASGIHDEVTLKLGVVRLHGELVRSDPMTEREAAAIRERVRGELAVVRERLGSRTADRLAIATGGTVRALARLVDDSAEVAGGPTLGADALRALCGRLVPSSHRERLAMRGIRKGRADLLPTGALILTALADELGLDGFRISDWGLREGVLLSELCQPG